MYKRQALAKKDEIAVEDLKGLPILESNQTFAPLAAAISGLCESRGFPPTFEFRTINSFAEMITYGATQAVRVFPMSVKDDPQLKMNQGMRLVPLADGTEDVYKRQVLLKRNDASVDHGRRWSSSEASLQLNVTELFPCY